MNEKMQRFQDGLKEIQAEAAAKARALARKMDQDGDGAFDLKDVRIAVEARTGPITKRDLFAVAFGWLAGLAFALVVYAFR
jgi:hypothetical protein